MDFVTLPPALISYPQSNGQVERMVQTIKRMLKKSSDPHIAVLSYRATPHPWCGFSPAELCMGRKIALQFLKPRECWLHSGPFFLEFRQKNAQFKEKQKEQFDHHHGMWKLPNDTEVWITSEERPLPGRVITADERPRSCGGDSYAETRVRMWYQSRARHLVMWKNHQHLRVFPLGEFWLVLQLVHWSSHLRDWLKGGCGVNPINILL